MCALSRVGLATASAILALSFPEGYAVTDSWVWFKLFGKGKSSFSLQDYEHYLGCLRPLAEALGRPVQEVEYARWEWARRERGEKR